MKAHKLFVLGFSLVALGLSARAQLTLGWTATPSNLSNSFASGYTLSNATSGSNQNAYAQMESFAGYSLGTSLQLNQFRFYLTATSGTTLFSAYVVQLTGLNGPIESVLWNSTPQTVVASSSYAAYTFDTGGLVLDSSKTYGLMLLADPASTGTAGVMSYGNTGYNNGYNYHAFNSTLTTANMTGYWNTFSNPNADFYFAAAFDQIGGTNSLTGSLTAVPEPTLPGLALGLSGLAGWAAWRRRKTAGPATAAA